MSVQRLDQVLAASRELRSAWKDPINQMDLNHAVIGVVNAITEYDDAIEAMADALERASQTGRPDV